MIRILSVHYFTIVRQLRFQYLIISSLIILLVITFLIGDAKKVQYVLFIAHFLYFFVLFF